ncbi:MAG: heparinase II/III family protein [Victivallales bacterium]|nr:heparinase II/III family protein [Victivallales bacterium]
MKLLLSQTLILLFTCCCLAAEDLIQSIREDHPRIYINAETIPLLRTRAQGVAKHYFEIIKKEVDALPDYPVLKLNEKRYRIDDDGRARFIAPAREGQHLVKYRGGGEALRTALVYLITNDPHYRDKAYRYLRVALELYQWCHKHWIQVEWHNFDRLDAIIAYDWLAASLSDEQRRNFIVPMLEFVNELQNGKYTYRRNRGLRIDAGFYGDRSLMWYAGLAAYGDGYNNALAGKMLETGYEEHVKMLDFRDKVSNSTGLLAAATPGYSFGAYPRATFNFLLSMNSATGKNIACRWTHMRDYPKWFSWAVIPTGDDFLHYGIGDAFHFNNSMAGQLRWSIYPTLAQSIHLYGKKFPDCAAVAKAAIALLPEQTKDFRNSIMPFILYNFDPQEKLKQSPIETLSQKRATYFPSFGLAIMRSGFTPESTFCLFRAGAQYTNHQHYDESHFTIYKHAFLAMDTGTRTATMHHNYYAPQTVAHNSILIHMKNEPLAPFWKPWGPTAEKDTYNLPAHGGQYKLSGAKRLAFTSEDLFTYVANDATATYHPGKCSEAVRQFVYIYPDYFVIYDRVESVDADQIKEFLIHTQNEPVQMPEKTWHADNNKGRLFMRTLLPKNARVDKIGGKGKRFMASGRNWPIFEGEKAFAKENHLGQWRLEVKYPQEQKINRFLHIIEATDTGQEHMIKSEFTRNGDIDIVKFTDRAGRKWQLGFNSKGKVDGFIKAWNDDKLILDKKLL